MRFVQRDGTTADVTFTGDAARILDAEGRVVVDWTTGGVLPDVPQGDGYTLEVTSNGVVTSEALAIGVVVLAAGQSNMARWFWDTTTLTPAAGTYAMGADGSWGAVTGIGAITFANTLAAELGVPVAIVNASVPGSSLTPERGGNIGYWGDDRDGGGPLYDAARALLAAVGGRAELVVWAQGEADYNVPVDRYVALLASLFTRFQGDLGNPQILIQQMGPRGAPGTSHFDVVRAAQEIVAQVMAGVSIGALTMDLALTDLVHFTQASYAAIATRMAMSSLAALGVSVPNEPSAGTVLGDVISGGDGRDTVLADAGDDQVQAGGDADVVFAGAGNDSAFGGGGDDVLFGDGGNDTLSGDEGGDVVSGGAGDDLLLGGAGNDHLFGDDGDDRLEGGEGNDVLEGGIGSDRLLAGGGNDRLFGAEGNDTLFGGAGADSLDGGAGADVINGGVGFDYAVYDASDVGDIVISLSRPSINTGIALGDTYIDIEGVIAGRGNDQVTGDGLNNFLFGGLGNDIIWGGGGRDQIYGEGGNDTLVGGTGVDLLAGGLGADELIGGGGADVFFFSRGFEGGTNVDRIVDFTAGVDVIRLARNYFAGLGNGPSLDPSRFDVLGHTTVDAATRIIYDPATGALSYDRDGSGAAAGVVFAVLAHNLALTSADFQVW